ncbi:MobF family relaxase [Nitratiruptor sp. SB155-2]|uniref:MobF family relaxase n=1 Tax=Nitratiruptor sp. (strain SB155-2) TaxID=387092 RepID=UPI0001586FA5|nr:MobF family relaxase [Nitratiruptor sp. SB155-2]BAF70794.1 conserved hypothetical protein [Nitratiruptor sp. SB155-2]
MISISKFQNKDQASSYYQEENYYQKNSENGFFHGAAAPAVGVKNGQEVTKDTFQSLLNNTHAITGEALTKNTTANKRAGFDVTFSAPKSVSVMMEALQANGLTEEALKLREAHERATQKAMEEIGKYALTRIRNEAGEIERIKAGIVYASFQHDTTRITPSGNIDPQLHTHNFIFNVVSYVDKNGEFKTGAIENFGIYKNKMYFGQLYRNELANNLKELGYKIEFTDAKNGFFELQDFKKEELKEFSGRSKSMRALIEEYREKYPNTNESKLLEIINQDIKPPKQEVEREEILNKNKNRLENIGITKERIEELLHNREKESEGLKQAKADEFIELTARAITETNSTFSKEEIHKDAMKLGLKHGITKEELEEAIKFNDKIIQLDNDIYTTIDVLAAEKYIISKVMDKTGQLYKDRGKIENFIKNNYDNMTVGQKEMFSKILISDSQFMVIQGDAGTGKTYSMKALKEFLEAEQPNREIIGLSFTGKAAAGLEEDSGIKSSTIHSFLYSEAKDEFKESKERLIIVDEAGLVGSRQIAKIIKIAKKNNDKVVFVGDVKQFKAIAAGDIFAEMQRRGAETITLGETLRQKTEFTKEVVRLTKDQEFDQLFSLLLNSNKLLEEDKGELYQQIVNDYFEKKGDLLIIASKNEDRKIINQIIKKKNNNSNKSIKITINEMQSFSGINKFFAYSYLNTTINIGKIPNFKNGEIVEVVDTKDEHTLIVRTERREEKELDLKKYADDIVVFKKVEKEFVVGEKIVFTKNSKEIKNGEIDYIKEIKEDGIILLKSGKSFYCHHYNYFDHGYAITDYKAQGVTARNVAILADSQIASFNSFYTQVTRAKEDLKIYTQNKEELRANVSKKAHKSSTLQYLKGEKNEHKRNAAGDFEKSGSYKKSISEHKREIGNIRKERLRFKELIYRSIEGLKSIIQFFSQRPQQQQPKIETTTKQLLKENIRQQRFQELLR